MCADTKICFTHHVGDACPTFVFLTQTVSRLWYEFSERVVFEIRFPSDARFIHSIKNLFTWIWSLTEILNITIENKVALTMRVNKKPVYNFQQ